MKMEKTYVFEVIKNYEWKGSFVGYGYNVTNAFYDACIAYPELKSLSKCNDVSINCRLFANNKRFIFKSLPEGSLK